MLGKDERLSMYKRFLEGDGRPIMGPCECSGTACVRACGPRLAKTREQITKSSEELFRKYPRYAGLLILFGAATRSYRAIEFLQVFI